ncbi:MAG: DMT family transporter [Alphaproteobacteria bacterium]|nr:DMT family transporter [Alphaproteobacteria bacterium]
MTKNMTMGAAEWALLAALALLWSGSFFFAKIALAELPPITLVLARVGLAAAVLLVIAGLWRIEVPWSWGLIGQFLVMGALNNVVPFALIFWGQRTIDTGLAAILNATTPIFTFLLAHVLTRDERLTRNRAAGVLFGLLGVTVLIGPHALAGFDLAAVSQLAIIAAALSYGFAGIYGRRFRGLPPIVPAAGMLTASTVMILPVALLFDRPWTLHVGGDTWAALAGLALLSTALGYVVYFRILAAAGATNLLLVTLLIPVGALTLGAFALGERLAWNASAGMALIFVGLTAIDGRVWRSLRRISGGA